MDIKEMIVFWDIKEMIVFCLSMVVCFILGVASRPKPAIIEEIAPIAPIATGDMVVDKLDERHTGLVLAIYGDRVKVWEKNTNYYGNNVPHESDTYLVIWKKKED